MSHEFTIAVDDTVYETLKPLIDQQTFGPLLCDFIQSRKKERPATDIIALRGILQSIDTSDIREEAERQGTQSFTPRNAKFSFEIKLPLRAFARASQKIHPHQPTRTH